jgi:predicted AlkP superfamily phosphohydrolase/phosphomutase
VGGATYRLDNCWSTIPTAVWPELTSGRSPGKAGLFYPPAQLRTGEAEPRGVPAEEVDPEGFWTIASDAGRRVAAIDLPWTVAPRALNGIFLAEWGTHDRWFGCTSFPAGLVDEVRGKLGDYPVGLCDDDYGSSLRDRELLAVDLVAAVEHEKRLLLDLLGRESWDLFACAFGQFQCVGHNFWGVLETSSDVPEPVRNAIFDVYVAVDGAVGALRREAGPDAVSMVVASHGMGALVGGPQLLPEVLVRLGAGSGQGVAADVRSRLPIGVRRSIRRVVPPPIRRRLQKVAGSLPAPLTSPATRAVAVPSDVNGLIRLNVRGREPYGSVEPGTESEAEIEHLRRALLELGDPATGEPIVTEVLSAEEAFGAGRHPDLPDLMVSFRTDLGALDACFSERVGLVKVPVRIANRTGDHNGTARLWLSGSGIEPRRGLGRAHALDVAPTVLALLGVGSPPRLDGHALRDVTG